MCVRRGLAKYDVIILPCPALSLGSHLITAANFCMNGKLAVVGTYDGRCMFYDTEVWGVDSHDTLTGVN